MERVIKSGDHVQVIVSFLSIEDIVSFIKVCKHWRNVLVEYDAWWQTVIQHGVLSSGFYSAWREYRLLLSELGRESAALSPANIYVSGKIDRDLRVVEASNGYNYVGSGSSAYDYVKRRFNVRPRHFDVAQCRQKNFRGHVNTIWTFEVDEMSERFAVTGGGDNRICVFNLNEDEKEGQGKAIRQFSGHVNEVFGLKLSSNQERMLSASRDHTVRVWDFESGTQIRNFNEHTGWVFSAEFFPESNDSLVASASFDSLIKIWDTRTPDSHSVHTLEGHTNAANCVSVSLFNDRHLWSSGNDGQLILWDIRSHASVIRHQNQAAVFHHIPLAHSAEEQVLACSQLSNVNVWNKQQVAKSFLGHTDWVKTARAVGNVLVTGSNDRSAKVWDIPSGNCLATLEDLHHDVLECVDFNDSMIVTGSLDQSIGIWMPQSLKKDSFSFSGFELPKMHRSSVIKVKLLTGNRILSCGGDQILKLTSF
jgi:WD40 repeat protein